MFQKSADQYKASATPAQLADLQRIHELQDKLKGPSAPTYQPLSPEEFARQKSIAETGQEHFSSEEMRQRQLDNRAARYKGVQDTRSDVELSKLNADIVKAGGQPVTKEQAQQLDLKKTMVDILEELKNQTAIWR
jgi:hypothetical protein